MDRQDNFIELLNDVKELAKATGNVLTAEELKETFSEVSLTEEQMKMVFQYLQSQGIGVSGFEEDGLNPFSVIEQSRRDEDEQKEAAEDPAEGLSMLEMYINEMADIPEEDPAEELRLFRRSKNGDAAAQMRLTELHLAMVADLACGMEKDTEHVDDLIQEGNLSLMKTLRALDEESTLAGYRAQLMNRVMKEMQKALEKEKNA